MSCSDYIPPSKSLLLDHRIVLDSPPLLKDSSIGPDHCGGPIITITRSSTECRADVPVPAAYITQSSASDRRHDPPCMPDHCVSLPPSSAPNSTPRSNSTSARLISSVKYDYDATTLLAHSESLIGPEYDPALYDVDVNDDVKKEDEGR